MKFKINNREWKITEVSQGEIKNIQNIRRANIVINNIQKKMLQI